VFLVGCCVKSSFGGRLRPRSVLFSLIFCRLNSRLKRRESASPHVLPRSHLVTQTPPYNRHCTSVGCCVSLRRLVAVHGRRVCFFRFIFRRSSRPLLKRRVIVPPPTFRRGRISFLFIPHRKRRLMVGCCVGWARGDRLRPRPGPPLSLFDCPIRRPKRQERILPTRCASTASHRHPPPPQPTFGWLLCLMMKWRPP